MEASSEPSGLDIERFLVFKLIEDLFFLSSPGFEPSGFGSGFGDSPSVRASGNTAGVAGECVTPVATGLGTRRGEDCAPYP